MEQPPAKTDLRQVSEVQLIYRSSVKASERPVIKSSRDAYDLLLSLWDKDTIGFIEQFNVLLMNRSNHVLGVYLASSGGITGTVADPRLILTAALKTVAVSLILAHNHPSGSTQPSRADMELTQKIKGAATYFDITVHDHLIITPEGYYSFSDEGLL
jgi:DNA repair protein RadC